jgi:hypothetical protein
VKVVQWASTLQERQETRIVALTLHHREIPVPAAAINGGIMKKSSLTAAASIVGLALVLLPADLEAAELQILGGGRRHDGSA